MTTITKQSRIIEIGKRQGPQQFSNDVLKGLSAPKKKLSSRYFYDEKGSRIFEEIMKLPEYYLTNTEWDILKTNKNDILDEVRDQPFQVVDLGAGDGKKTKVLLEHFYKNNEQFEYVPIDINRDILIEIEENLNREMPEIEITPIIAEYFDALKWINDTRKTRKLVLFLGSNIGNFTKKAAAGFLSEMQQVLDKGDYLLIGIDLKKDPQQILNAYSDSQGVTAEFNLNLLKRINTELGGNFNLKKWTHFANYNPINGAVKSFLVSTENQEVFIQKLNKTFKFDPYEAIHTEYSYKYDQYEIENMAVACGYKRVKNFISIENPFCESLWKVV